MRDHIALLDTEDSMSHTMIKYDGGCPDSR